MAELSKQTLLWDFIVENNIATDDECSLVTNINGYTVESLMEIIRARTGLRSLTQCLNEKYDFPHGGESIYRENFDFDD